MTDMEDESFLAERVDDVAPTDRRVLANVRDDGVFAARTLEVRP